MKKFLCVVLCLALALSLAACAGGGNAVVIDDADDLSGTSDTYGTVEVTATKDAYNFLTGENNLASDRVGFRPTAVSVGNTLKSWPQRGVSYADVIFEIETEGGISRLMCLYADSRAVDLIGSVRSLRDQFLEIVYPLDPIILHIGTSIYADGKLAANNFRTIDANVFESTLYVDRDRMQTYQTEHCKFTSASLIENGIELANIKTESMSAVDSLFNFVTDGSVVTPAGGSANRIYYEISKEDEAIFTYNAEDGKYYKSCHVTAAYPDGQAMIDELNGQQCCFENVFVLFCNMSYTNDDPPLVRLDYNAGGTGYYFTNGAYEEVTWTKGDYSSNIVITGADGNEITVNTGKSHVGIVNKEMKGTLEIA